MPQPARTHLALPTVYLLLATVATAVQWKKWQMLHRSRNLVALGLSLLILVIASAYLLRAFRDKRRAGS